MGTKTGTRKCTYGSYEGAMLSYTPDRLSFTTSWRNSSVCLQEDICDVAATGYTNDIGDALSIAYWKDSDFDRNGRALHHIRMPKFPTDRWTTHDATRKN